ncbi:phage integrase central domain-containing protein [Agrobacterium tumefaciens]|uniref:phage integrase central domain-containing protein n=1 Tax=Agrobacterium tumefaciens TaxID=358 RepID=UPI003C7A98FD
MGAPEAQAIDAAIALGTLRMVDRRGAIETSMRLHQRISAVSVYAITRPARE